LRLENIVEMAMGIIETIEKEQHRREIGFRSGDNVRVHVRIKEGDKERVQVFEGVVIALKRGGNRGTFTVRKVSSGMGVERVFPLQSPSIEKIEVVSSGKVRRSRLFFLRERRGKAARLKERDTRLTAAAREAAAAAAALRAEVAPDAAVAAPV
jgi:large subunit ribosomal protein L19